METSIFLFKFWGWYCITFFFILSINPKRIKQIIDDLKNEKFLILISLVAIIIGLLNVLFHNIWESNSKIIITLFGWSALLKGIMLFAYPKIAIRWIEHTSLKLIQVMYMFLFFIGLFLLNEAYKIVPY